MLTELQWLTFQDTVRSLAQLRYCLFNTYLEGAFLYLEVKSCDAEQQRYLYIIVSEGDLL